MSDTPRPENRPPEEQGSASDPTASNGTEGTAADAAEPIFASDRTSDGTAPRAAGSAAEGAWPRQAPEPRLPGPGLPEAIAWAFGVFAVHIGGALFIVLLIGLAAGLSRGAEAIPAALREIESTSMTLLGGEQLIFVLVAIGATVLRLGRGFRRKLALDAPAPGHLLIACLLVLPVALCSGELYRIVMIGWELVTDAFPLLKLLDGANVVAQMQQLVEKAPLPLLLMVLAVAPALGEEIIFRGVVGRGLVARWGIYWGVLLSSALFAAVHMHPAHVLSVLPIGVLLHILYLTTRSFWVPVLFHFLNNAWATIAVKYLAADDSDPVSVVMLVPSLVCILALLNLLWTTRREFLLPDGPPGTPGDPTAETPPSQLEAVPQCGRATAGALAFAAAGVVAVVLAMTWMAMA